MNLKILVLSNILESQDTNAIQWVQAGEIQTNPIIHKERKSKHTNFIPILLFGGFKMAVKLPKEPIKDNKHNMTLPEKKK